jgi:hypothetical protein
MLASAISSGDRPVDRWRRFVRTGLIPALVFALSGDVMQFEASTECRGGAFSAAFGRGFGVARCDVVVKRFGDDLFKLPLPASW